MACAPPPPPEEVAATELPCPPPLRPATAACSSLTVASSWVTRWARLCWSVGCVPLLDPDTENSWPHPAAAAMRQTASTAVPHRLAPFHRLMSLPPFVRILTSGGLG